MRHKPLGSLACCAVGAIDTLLEKVHRIEVVKALDPMNPDDFLVIVKRFSDAMRAAAEGAEAAALRAAMAALDVDWRSLTPAEVGRVVDAAREALLPITGRVMPSIAQEFEIRGPEVMAATRAGAIDRFGLNIATSLSLRDQQAEQYIRAAYSNMITNAYGDRIDALAAEARDIVANGLEFGLGRDEIATQLEAALGTSLMRGQSYFQVVATSYMNTARTASLLNSYADAGIESYRFEAVMDEATCFAAGTRVRLPNGRSRRIEQIRPGDEVMSCRGVARRVTALRVFAKRTWGTIELSSGKTLRVTPNHPILTLRGWVAAGHLTEEDRLVAYDRTAMPLLWDPATNRTDWTEEGIVRCVPPERANATEGVQGMRRDVPARLGDEERDEGLLLGSVPHGDEDVRALLVDVRDPSDLRCARARAVLLADVSESRIQEGCTCHAADVRGMPRSVRRIACGGAHGEASPALLEGVSEEARRTDMRVLLDNVRSEARIGPDDPVLLDRVLPEVRGRDEHRGDGSPRARGERVRVRAGSEDREVVGGFPRRESRRARSRRGVLALESERPGARREKGRCDGGARLPRDPSRGAGGAFGSEVRDPRLARLWPYPVEDIGSVATTVGIIRIGWELTTSDEPAYDIEVDEDAGYIAEGVVVHNTDQCRFYHDQVFRVSDGVAAMNATLQSSSIEELQNANPWVRVGRDDAGSYMYFERDGQRTEVARIESSGIGTQSAGTYSASMSSAQLSTAGIPYPPLHGNCRSTIVPAGPGF